MFLLENQFYAALSANIITLSYGSIIVWPSANFLILTSEKDTPFKKPMTNEEASWVGAILCVGGLIGNFFFAILGSKFGRKFSLQFVAIPGLMSWLLIFFSTNVTYLLVARFFGGMQGGGVLALVPVYVTEIAEDSVRGMLGSFFTLSINSGILLAYILVNFLTYRTMPLVLASVPVLFFLNFIRLPETPQQLLTTYKDKEAEMALSYYRNYRRIQEIPPEIRSEIEKIKATLFTNGKSDEKDSGRVSCSDFCNRRARKAIMIGIALIAQNQLSGSFAMVNYTTSIFKQSGSTLSPNASAIVVVCIQLLGGSFTTMLVERSGRKFFLITSAIGTGMCEFCLGSYSLLDEQGYDVKRFNWVPLVSFSLAQCIVCMGLAPIAHVVITEIMPPKIRPLGCMICIFVAWVFAFLTLKFFPIAMHSIGLYGVMYFCGSCCFVGPVFVFFVVPETKGKSVDEIMRML